VLNLSIGTSNRYNSTPDAKVDSASTGPSNILSNQPDFVGFQRILDGVNVLFANGWTIIGLKLEYVGAACYFGREPRFFSGGSS
jgi:hypothetical protein